MVARYFGVVFVLVSVAISVNYAQGSNSTNSSSIFASPTISMNSTAIVNTSIASTPVLITSTQIVPPMSSAKLESSIPPAPASTSSVIPSASPTATPTTKKAPTKAPHGKPTKGRSFDTASFFGGIILGVIVMIAGFLGFTWWQNKRKSYHSL